MAETGSGWHDPALHAQFTKMRDDLEDLDSELEELKLKRKNMVKRIVRVTRDHKDLAESFGLPTQLSMRGKVRGEKDEEGSEGGEEKAAEGAPAAG